MRLRQGKHRAKGAGVSNARWLVASIGTLAIVLSLIWMSQIRRALEPADLDNGLSRHRAALLDQVGLTDPNPEFVEEALQYLVRAGYDVDVYSALVQ